MGKIKGIFLLSVILLADFRFVPVLTQMSKANIGIAHEITGDDKNGGSISALEMIEAVLEAYKKIYIVCSQVTDGYEVTVYEKGKKIFSETYPIEPGINEITEGIYEIRISVGSPAAYVYYINTQDFKISTVYFNPILFGNGYVAYMENDELILTDLFQEGILDKRVVRDFTKTADPISAIIKIEMQDNENIVLEYYKGADYVEELEIIKIGK